MQKIVFSIYDQITQVYSTPFFATNVPHGQRLFANAVQDVHSEISRNPHDFDLVQLGTFDDLTGAIEYTPLQKNPLNGGSLVKA